MHLRNVGEMVNAPLPMGKVRGIQLAITPLTIAWFLMLGIWVAWWFPVVLMVTIGVHEYGHILVGERLKYKAEILLFEPMGAVVVMEPRAQTAQDDIRISVAGPVVNLVVGLVLLPVVLVLYYGGFDGSSAFFPILATCAVNFFLALFNMLPIYPLDGGRMFRAWAIKKYGWDRGSMLTRNVGIAVGTAVGGLFWLRGKRLSALLMMPYIHDCIRGLQAQERQRKETDPFGRLEEWSKHRKRQQESR